MFEWKKSAGKIYTLPVESIRPSPFQARTVFDEKELAGLAQSIRENGLLQPISVRKVEGGYELVAGERRLRACKLARMETIPAILCDCGDQRTAALGLLENIQREDLNPFEQAQGLRDVIALWDCTQAEAAKRLGMAQPTLANKLRLLQLTTDQRQFVLDNGLTERHARAVLRLPENRRSEALITIAKRRMNARQTDLYIAQCRRPGQTPHLHGQGCAHLCQHHRPCHPADDGQRCACHGPQGRAGRLYRIHGAHSNRSRAKIKRIAIFTKNAIPQGFYAK